MNEIEAHIARVLSESIRPGGNATLGRDTSLLEGGLDLDSVELLELVVTLEKSFEVTIEDDELKIELFETIGSLAAFLGAKSGADA
jgi:acyl carrier protein